MSMRMGSNGKKMEAKVDPIAGAAAGVVVGDAVIEVIAHAVAGVFNVAPEALRAETRRDARTAFARQVAMYLAHTSCGFSLTQSGRLFGRDRTTAAHACRVIEDGRDDPLIDRSLEHLEVCIRGLAAARQEIALR